MCLDLNRFHMPLFLKTEEVKSRSGVARDLGTHCHTVSDWLDLYEEGGIEKIQQVEDPVPEPGQQSIPPETIGDLKECFAEPVPPDSSPEPMQQLVSFAA